MESLTYKSNNTEEIKQLFTKVFPDSEGQTEGVLIAKPPFTLTVTQPEGWLGQSLL